MNKILKQKVMERKIEQLYKHIFIPGEVDEGAVMFALETIEVIFLKLTIISTFVILAKFVKLQIFVSPMLYPVALR